jgi:ribosomal protein S12 methylthiotransferase accessory factor
LPLESLVSPFVGVVRGMQDVLAGPEDVRLATAWCESAFPHALVGGGSGTSVDDARAAAIGEAMERYSACIVDPDACVIASARELGDRAVDPARFALFSETQYSTAGFPYARFDRDTQVAWIEGFSLPEGRPAWLPAQLVHLAGHESEPPLCRTTSSGLACHASVGDATVAALLELLERDAFMITWKARLSWPLLDWGGHDVLTEFERAFLRPTGLQWRAIDLSAFWDIPIVAAVVRGGDTLGVGAAAAASIERAVTKALDEAARVRTWAFALRAHGQVAPLADEIEEFDDHVHFYADPRNAPRVRFLDGSERRRRVESVPAIRGKSAEARIETICRRLARRRVTAYAVDVTAPDVREAGLAVMRVIAPELCALDVEHNARLLGGGRLYDEPLQLGARERRLTEADINPDPHPFP